MTTSPSTIYDFVWNEFCDWYLEIAKVQIQTGNEAQQRATRRTLIRTLETIFASGPPGDSFRHRSAVAKVAPVAGRAGASIAIAAYPEAQRPEKIDEAAIAYVGRIKPAVGQLPHARRDGRLPRTAPAPAGIG